MKVKNILTKGALLTATLGLLIACAPEDLEPFKKERAIKRVNDINYRLNQYSINSMDEISLIGSYIKADGRYYSAFNNSYIYSQNGDPLRSVVIDNNTFYTFDDGRLFDSFGNYINVEYSSSYDRFQHFTILVGKGSMLYNQFSQLLDNKEGSDSIQMLDCLYNSYNQIGVCKRKGDSQYNFNYVYRGYENDFLDDSHRINRLNSREYFVYNEDEKIKVSYDESMVDKLMWNHLSDNVNEEYKTILSIAFNGSRDIYSYKIKEVEGISNDFTYIRNGIRYKAKVTGKDGAEMMPNYFPLDYILSKDCTFAYLLVKQIKEDGVLSNKYFTVRIDNTLQAGDLVMDTSLFDGKQYYQLNDQLYLLEEGEELIYLNGTKAIYLDESKTIICRYNETTSGWESLHENDVLINNYTLAGKLYFLHTGDTGSNYLTSVDVDRVSKNKVEVDHIFDKNLMIYTVNGNYYSPEGFLISEDEILTSNSFQYILDGVKQSVFVMMRNSKRDLLVINQIDTNAQSNY